MSSRSSTHLLRLLVLLTLIALAVTALWGCRPAAAESEPSQTGGATRPAAESLRDGQALSEIDRFFGAPLGVPQRTN